MHAFDKNPTRSSFDCFAESLKHFMIRHMKSQRISGNEALSLPPSTTTTIMLNMSKDEDRAFNFINSSQDYFDKLYSNGAKRFAAERIFTFPLGKILRDGVHKRLMEEVGPQWKSKKQFNPAHLSKIIALRKDLQEQRKLDPSLKAVVFTRSLDIHAACVKGLTDDSFEIFQFTGSSNSQKRDEAIHDFQNINSCRPSVFIITLRAGNVSVTLTAASRVYLLEPFIDPGVEVQAAGKCVYSAFWPCEDCSLFSF
jgi:SWI/SNF-related matrix-associated actin-dependent regulator of chromatin subfamily A3